MPKTSIHPEWYPNAKVYCDGQLIMKVGSTKPRLNVDFSDDIKVIKGRSVKEYKLSSTTAAFNYIKKWIESHLQKANPRRRKNAGRIKAMKKEGKGDFVLQWFPLSVLTPEMLHTDLWYNETQSRKFFHIANQDVKYNNS